MSELTPNETFPGPDEVLRQVRLFIAESTAQILRYGCSVYNENYLFNDDPETHRDIKAEMQELANENTVAISGVSQVMKAQGYEFALFNNQYTRQYRFSGIAFTVDLEDGGYSGYQCHINHPAGSIWTVLNPYKLVYQQFKTAETPTMLFAGKERIDPASAMAQNPFQFESRGLGVIPPPATNTGQQHLINLEA